jgi:hypothetical protein
MHMLHITQSFFASQPHIQHTETVEEEEEEEEEETEEEEEEEEEA